jgi:chromate reductase
MDRKFKVAVLVGSLRKESYNRKMARALTAVAPPSLGTFVETATAQRNQDLKLSARPYDFR